MRSFILGATALFALASCGETLTDQALIGAGAGVAGAVVLEGDIVTGAALGAAANALYCQQNPSKC